MVIVSVMTRFFPYLLIFLALAIAGFTLFGANGYPRLQGLRQSLVSQSQSNFELGNRVERLRRDVVGLQDDDRMIEKAARTELGMARTDEMVFIFDQEPNSK